MAEESTRPPDARDAAQTTSHQTDLSLLLPPSPKRPMLPVPSKAPRKLKRLSSPRQTKPGEYVVLQGSETGHCCFAWSVVSGGDVVCECFEREAADAIAAALNLVTAMERIKHV